jgi:hypothetical protein
MERATAPTPWATPSQTAATPRNSSVKSWATGPGPLRTARGAGRLAAADRDLGAGLRALELRELVLRDRVLEPLRPEPRELLPDLDEDVLLLRDPGGEDVRVAMVTTLGGRHTSPRDHTSACLAGASHGAAYKMRRLDVPRRTRCADSASPVRPR